MEEFYKKRIIPKSQASTLDLFSARDIYKRASKKFSTKFSEELMNIKVKFLTNRLNANFPECLIEKPKFEVLLIRASQFRNTLHKFELFKELDKFDTIRKVSLERLIMNANLLKI